MAGVTVADVLGLIPVLAAAYGVVLGAVALLTAWQLCSDRQPRSERRFAVVPPEGVIEQAGEGAR